MRTKTTLEKAVKFVNNCKFIFSFKKNIFQKSIFSILFCLITSISFAQTENVDSYIANLENSGQEAKAAHLRHLLYDLQSAVYSLSSGAIELYGEQPTALFSDTAVVGNLNTAIAVKDNIEIATIKIENTTDLNRPIDLSNFSGFQNLQYIYIISEVKTSQAVINNLIRNNSSKYVLIYKIVIGG